MLVGASSLEKRPDRARVTVPGRVVVTTVPVPVVSRLVRALVRPLPKREVVRVKRVTSFRKGIWRER